MKMPISFKMIFLSACSLAVMNVVNAQSTDAGNALSADSASANMLAACQSSQDIVIANALDNSKLPDSGMTKTDFLVKLYSGLNVCWTSTIEYARTDTFHSGSGCGCVQAITSIDIVPIARAGDIKSAYVPQTITVPASRYPVQMSVIQGTMQPAFDANTGLVTTQGTLKANMQATSPK
jgi:hypothetical protein